MQAQDERLTPLNHMVAVDHGKVARLRQAIADGAYAVAPDRIAAALIARERVRPQTG